MRMTRGPENVTHEERLSKLSKEKLMRARNPVGKHNTY